MGGPIALIKNGDVVTINAEKQELSVALTKTELARRAKSWKPRKSKETGWLAR